MAEVVWLRVVWRKFDVLEQAEVVFIAYRGCQERDQEWRHEFADERDSTERRSEEGKNGFALATLMAEVVWLRVVWRKFDVLEQAEVVRTGRRGTLVCD
jgi:uncharacterized membrane protein